MISNFDVTYISNIQNYFEFDSIRVSSINNNYMLNEKDLTVPLLTFTEKIFTDEETCVNYFTNIRWPDGPKCVHVNDHGEPCLGDAYPVARKNTYRCRKCCRGFGVFSDTIFENKKKPFREYFLKYYFMATDPRSVSSNLFEIWFGEQQKTSWHHAHMLREVMGRPEVKKLKGIVYIDDSATGGKRKNKHSDKKEKNWKNNEDKTYVMHLREENGQRLTFDIPDNLSSTVIPLVLEYVEKGSLIITDTNASYESLSQYFNHLSVDHSKGYAFGLVCNNKSENVFSIIDNTTRGTYRHVSRKHINRYNNQIDYRQNNLTVPFKKKFDDFLLKSIGVSLKYRQLVGENGYKSRPIVIQVA
ncbi:MAG: IS1595 family transposase [Pedobacter sp.]|nr:MAG: IS1595 family transposase [Pedobacter sp.]